MSQIVREKKTGAKWHPGVDIFSQLTTILRSAGVGSAVYSSDQVFAQAGNGIHLCFLEFFLG